MPKNNGKDDKVLVLLFTPDLGEVLLGKWTDRAADAMPDGIGGMHSAGSDPYACARREMGETAGISYRDLEELTGGECIMEIGKADPPGTPCKYTYFAGILKPGARGRIQQARRDFHAEFFAIDRILGLSDTKPESANGTIPAVFVGIALAALKAEAEARKTAQDGL